MVLVGSYACSDQVAFGADMLFVVTVEPLLAFIINPQRACARGVITVVVLCVCVCVCPFSLFCLLVLLGVQVVSAATAWKMH